MKLHLDRDEIAAHLSAMRLIAMCRGLCVSREGVELLSRTWQHLHDELPE